MQKWTIQEINLLKEYYKNPTKIKLLKKLLKKYTNAQIRSKSSRLGLKLPAGRRVFYRTTEVGKKCPHKIVPRINCKKCKAIFKKNWKLKNREKVIEYKRNFRSRQKAKELQIKIKKPLQKLMKIYNKNNQNHDNFKKSAEKFLLNLLK